MMAGIEGPGGIAFDNHALSFAIGSVCLAFIIFDGGLRTSWKSIRPSLPLGISLSFFGTLVTAISTAAFTHLVIGLPLLESSLLGAIVSSTDAAAVFSILRAKNLSLKGSLKPLLEFEAGSNDPIAVLLTISVLAFARPDGSDVQSILTLFVVQTGLGFIFGLGGGRVMRWLINHVGIEYEGLYSVLLLGLVILLFAITSYFGGSGFLAVYIAGIVLGNAELLHKGSITKFMDGIAWITQILVFLTLGLLAYPSHLLSVWKEGLILGFFMMLVARPVSVLIAAPGRALARDEKLFVSWVGLRGAAPVILATLPWSINFPNAEFIFNLVFFVVLISVISQGISIPWMASLLKVTRPLDQNSSNAFSSEMLPSGFELVEVELKEGSQANDQRIVDLSLPSGILFTSIERGENYLIPRGDTVLQIGDKISGLARESNFETLKLLFGEVKKIKKSKM